jgi:predicted permease
MLLALAGGSLGVALAPAAIRGLIAFLPQGNSANALQSTLDSRLLGFAFLVSLAAGLLSGFAPALQAGRESLIAGLRARAGAGLGGARLRKSMVTVQIALSLILLIGAVLFVRTLAGLLAKGPGFDTSSLISFGLNPRRNGYSPAKGGQILRRIHDEINASATTRMSGLASLELLNGGSWNDAMTIQTDRRFVTDKDADINSVTPGFFATLGIRVLAGRDFDEHDTRPADTPDWSVAIVNESFVKRYLNGRDPLGVHIGEGYGPDVKPNVEIVGVVSDFNYRGLRDQSEQVFFPGSQNADGAIFYVKVRGSSEQAFQSIRAIVHNADPALPILSFRTLDEQIDRSLNTERLLATLSGAFGLLALLLSLVGLYGVMSLVVTQRTREIGIRIALGATARAAIWLVLRDAIAMITAGIAIALPCIAALARLIQSQLFGVKPTDPAAIAQSILLLATAVLIAALIPAWRAATVNPIDALRLE